MSCIQDISFDLMKSPRELASWNFPLSKILEEYFKVLPEPCNIRYGEAALVIQNSVNAYVRKVEELYDETQYLNQKMFTSFHADDKNRQRCKKSKNTFMYLDRFGIIDFQKEVGQNINLKNHKSKSIKFFNQCFSLLENPCINFDITIVDGRSKIIGKKYDYRCNQQVMRNGLLAEEISPGYLKQWEFNTCNKVSLFTVTNWNKNMICKYSINKSEINVFDKKCIMEQQTYDLDNPFMENSEKYCISDFLLNDKEKNVKTNKLGQPINDSLLSDSENGDFNDPDDDYYDSDFNKILLSSTNDLDQNKYAIQLEKDESCITNISETKDSTINQVNTLNADQKCTADISIPGILVAKDNESYLEVRKENSMHGLIHEKNTLRRSRRIQKKKGDFWEINKNDVLKALTFRSGTPRKSVKQKKAHNKNEKCQYFQNSTKVKTDLTAQSLLKKKKVVEDTNSHILSLKVGEVKTHSKKHQNSCTQKGNQGIVELSGSKPICRSECFAISYQPVLTMNMDLKELCPNYENQRNGRGSTEIISYDFSSYSSLSSISDNLTSTSHIKDYNLNNCIQNKESNNIRPKSWYFGQFIKHKIKEIHREFDQLSDCDYKVAKWHQKIKFKLMEAESKPPFCIHEYEACIMQQLKKCNNKMKFKDLIGNKHSSEIARFFSATLQLASSNHLSLCIDNSIEENMELILQRDRLFT